MPPKISSYTIGMGLLLVAFVGCGKQESRYIEVSEVPPPAVAEQRPSERTSVAEIQEGKGDPGFRYAVPEGWTEVAPSSMKLISLMCGASPEQQAECSVSVFPGDVGGQLANINRWRRQVGLGPLSGEAVAGFVESVQISGMEGWRVDFTGPSGANRVVVAVLFRGGQSWFFKLMGPEAAVAGELEAFDVFLAGVQF
jgi:hypothetical protein